MELLRQFQEQHSCADCNSLVQGMLDYYQRDESISDVLSTSTTDPPGAQTVAFLNTKALHKGSKKNVHKKQRLSEPPMKFTLDEMQMLSDASGLQLLESCFALWKRNRLMHIIIMGDLQQTMPVAGRGRFLQACQAVLPVQQLHKTWRFEGNSALETLSTLFSGKVDRQEKAKSISLSLLRRTFWPKLSETQIRKTLSKLITISSKNGVFNPAALVFVSLRNTEAEVANFWAYNREFMLQKKRFALHWQQHRPQPLFLGLCVSVIQEAPWFDKEDTFSVWEDAWARNCRKKEVQIHSDAQRVSILHRRPPLDKENLCTATRGTRGTIVALSIVRALQTDKKVVLKTEKVFSSTSETFPTDRAIHGGKRFVRILLFVRQNSYCEVFVPCPYKTVWPYLWSDRSSGSKKGVVLGYASGLPCLTGLQFDQVVALMPPTMCPLLLYSVQVFYTMITRAVRSFRSLRFPRGVHTFSRESLCTDLDETVVPNTATEAELRNEMNAYLSGERKTFSLVQEWASGRIKYLAF